MTTTELFNKISTTQEFKGDENSRVWKHRHNKGTLSSETYSKIFATFGYIKPDKWVKKK